MAYMHGDKNAGPRAVRLESLALAAATLVLGGASGFGLRAVMASGIPTGPTLHYSGTVLENGAPFSGVKNITVSLWTAQDGGAMVCERPRSTVAVAAGRFRVELPDTCVMAVRTEPNLWVQTTVDAASFARTKLGAVPYAVEADRAGSVSGAQAAQLVPSGAVMAFDLDACPPGWSTYAPAGGRTIIGVTAGGTGVTARARRDTLGEETHALAVNEMPGHTHTHEIRSIVGPFTNSTTGLFTTGGSGVGANFGSSAPSSSAGEGRPFTNYQPSIALRYCLKD
jgi:hypothetical protein